MLNVSHLENLLLEWEDRYEQGEDVSAEQLCREHPELVGALEEQIAELKKLSWLETSDEEDPSCPVGGDSVVAQDQILAGRYRLEVLVGEGGYGQVWRAFDLELHRAVAIKVPRQRSYKPKDEDAFLVEARKVAQLKHPGIVSVYDVGLHEGAYFIVSELVDGADLSKRLRERPVSLREAMRIVAEAARHLHHAHQQGFIHRDIKPANLIVDRQGRVYVTDFGISLTSEEHSSQRFAGCGTLAYMAPEQLDSPFAVVDARTDVYSLGVVLYQLLTGRLPFETDTPQTSRERILRHEPPPPGSFRQHLPAECVRICLKCLEKKPECRYSTAKALSADLTACLVRKRWDYLGVGLLLLALLLLTYSLLETPKKSINEDPKSISMSREGYNLEIPLSIWEKERLYDGMELRSWVVQRGKKINIPTIGVNEAGMKLMGQHKAWLRTKRKFGDIILRVKYRIQEQPPGGTVTFLPCMEDDAHPVEEYLRVEIVKSGYPRLVVPPGLKKSTILQEYPGIFRKKMGYEWNQLQLLCCSDKIEVDVNDQTIATAILGKEAVTRNEAIDALKKGDKISLDDFYEATIPHFSPTEKGFVGFGADRVDVELRDLTVTPLGVGARVTGLNGESPRWNNESYEDVYEIYDKGKTKSRIKQYHWPVPRQ